MTAQFLSVEPQVKLVNAFADPFRTILDTAKTCYSGHGVVEGSAIDSRGATLARDLYTAGHHTTIQHAQFLFSISNVSRLFIHAFLHSHPWYNSEQVSQRYVHVRPGSYAVPPLESTELERYQQCVRAQIAAYERLTECLLPVVEEEYFRIFPARRASHRKFRREMVSKAQEEARYVLPVATFAYLYHTVSAVSLLRYYKASRFLDCPLEQQVVASKMIDELLRVDSSYKEILEDPLPSTETPEWPYWQSKVESGEFSGAHEFLAEFDGSLGGRRSNLIDYKVANEAAVASAVRSVLGVPARRLSDEDAIHLTLDPKSNKTLNGSLNITSVSKVSRALYHASYTFRKRVSHACDSQNQRHRTTPASRPILSMHYTPTPDFVIPRLIADVPEARAAFLESMESTWNVIESLRRAGVPLEYALYLLPNAVAVRLEESADLLSYRHKAAMRLCYNAQDEIWRVTLEEVEQIAAINPRLGKYLLPPCTLRLFGRSTPICPEGKRYCGVPVWRLERSEYVRRI